jgi:hypothetical protein
MFIPESILVENGVETKAKWDRDPKKRNEFTAFT